MRAHLGSERIDLLPETGFASSDFELLGLRILREQPALIVGEFLRHHELQHNMKVAALFRLQRSHACALNHDDFAVLASRRNLQHDFLSIDAFERNGCAERGLRKRHRLHRHQLSAASLSEALMITHAHNDMEIAARPLAARRPQSARAALYRRAPRPTLDMHCVILKI